jgi:hypothetical protein
VDGSVREGEGNPRGFPRNPKPQILKGKARSSFTAPSAIPGNSFTFRNGANENEDGKCRNGGPEQSNGATAVNNARDNTRSHNNYIGGGGGGGRALQLSSVTAIHHICQPSAE